MPAAAADSGWRRPSSPYRVGVPEQVGLLRQHGIGVDIHCAKTTNSKGYYRRFGSTLINRVKDSMLKEGIISVEFATEIDDRGRER